MVRQADTWPMNDAPPLPGGAAGPQDPDMAVRVQRLEDTLRRIEALLTSVDERLRKVEIEVAEIIPIRLDPDSPGILKIR